jgi:BASS family bile acid:Na+ symporter
VLDVLLPMVFLPIALGFVIRDASPRATAILIRISDFFYVIGVIASVIVILLKGMPLIEALLPPIAIFATLIITVSDAAFGYWAGSPNLEDRKAVALAAALGNPALALAVVEVSYPELQAEVLVTVYLVIRGIAMIPIEWWLKKKPPKIAEVSSQ